jgi:hypothetical protein
MLHARKYTAIFPLAPAFPSRRSIGIDADFLKRGVGRLDLTVALRHKTVRGEKFTGFSYCCN